MTNRGRTPFTASHGPSCIQIGYVEGGAETVVDALRKVVGPEGTVMVPTFKHGGADIYDLRATPSTLVAGHLEVDTFSRRSPLGKLADHGGSVLLFGVGMRANTAAQIGETMACVHCLGFNQFPRRVRLEDGRVIPAWSAVWRGGPCLIEWDPLEARLRARGLIHDGRMGGDQLSPGLGVFAPPGRSGRTAPAHDVRRADWLVFQPSPRE